MILPNDESDYVDGTSIAASFVTGAACLILSVDDKLSPSEVKKVLLDSAKTIDDMEDKCVSGGCLDINEALSIIERRR